MNDYGTCPFCHAWRPLTKAGGVRWHLGERGTKFELKDCPGSGQKPVEDVSWVADVT